MHVENEIHLMRDRHAGHIESPDCWCEPVRIYLAAVNGIPGLQRVIEHNDDIHSENHLVIVSRRDRDRHLLCTNFRESYDAAITRALTPPWTNEGYTP